MKNDSGNNKATQNLREDYQQFLLAELDVVANAFFSNTNTITAFFRHYLLVVSLPITIALAVSKIGNESETTYAFFQGIACYLALGSFAVTLIGYSVIGYLFALRAECVLYARTANGIRRYFYSLDILTEEEAQAIRVLPINTSIPKYFEPFGFGFAIYAIAIINMIYGTVSARLFLYTFSIEGLFLYVVMVAAACFFLLSSIALYQYLARKCELLGTRILGVDLDGVLGDLATAVINYCNSQFSKKITRQDITSHNINQCLGLTEEQVNEIFSTPDIFMNLTPIFGAKSALCNLKKRGWIINIMTDRFWHDNDWSISRSWLSNHRFQWDHLNLVKAKHKPEYAKAHGISLFVEDNLETARELASVCNTVFLLNDTYNQGKVPQNVKRVKNWQEIVSILIDSQAK